MLCWGLARSEAILAALLPVNALFAMLLLDNIHTGIMLIGESEGEWKMRYIRKPKYTANDKDL